MRRSRTSLVAALAVGAGLGISSVAHAITCEDIMNMVDHNVPSSVVVDTIKGSGTQFDDSAIQCLKQRGAPGDVLAAALEFKAASAPAPSEEELEEEDPRDAAARRFNQAESLGGGDLLDESGADAEPSLGGAADVNQYINDYKAKKYRTASYGLYTLLSENAYPEQDSTIKYYLAKSLQALELYHSAQYYYMEVVRKGPSNPAFKLALPRLVKIAAITGNDTELDRIVAKVAPEAFPRPAAPYLYYLLGRKAYADESFAEAAAYFENVPLQHELYPRAQYYQGVIAYERDKFRTAAKAFREVIRAEVPTDDPDTVRELEDLKDLSLINIARIYYSLQRFDNAEKYYAKVDRDSAYWPQALFERAWTTFYTGDINASLGHLMTATSPFFSDTNFLPDTQYLRALIYFQLCEYDEVERIVKIFQADHRPMRTEIKDFLDRYRTEEGRQQLDRAFDEYFGANASTDTALPVSLFQSVLRNRDLAALVRHMDMMQRELAAIDAQTPQWRDTIGAQLGKVIATDAQRYKERAGRRFAQEMLGSFRQIDDLLQDTDILEFELSNAQLTDYMFRASNPTVSAIDEQPIDFATQSDVVYWPFNGEFWRDELAYYRFSERGSCR